MYVVQDAGRKQEYDNRGDAVRAARRRSKRTHRQVKVLRDGGIERMLYRNGKLQEGHLLTRDRRGRGNLFR